MKKITIISLVILVALSPRCSLVEEPVDQISTDFIYESVGGLQVAVNALYSRMRVYNYPAWGNEGILKANFFLAAGTDLGHTRTWHRPYGETHTPAGFPGDKWTIGYDIIDKANAIITFSEDVPGDQDDIDYLVAQARMVRGEVYFELIRMYGRILLDTTPTTPENAFDDVIYEPANSVDVFNLIKEDFDFAIANLDYTEGFGRYNQGVARLLRGKVSMWLEEWTDARDQFDEIINNSGLDLVPITQVFGQDLNHNEAMLVYTRDELLGGNDNLAGGGNSWWGAMFTNRAYEMSDNQMLHAAEDGGQALGWSFPNDYLQSLYDQDNDLRYKTYFYDLDMEVNNPENPNFGQPIVPDDNFRRYHFSLRKWYDDDKGLYTNDSWKNIMDYRFAEVLLLGAEAHWHADGENPGNAKALEYINRVRRRAYGVGDTTYDYTQFTLDNYLDESARELAMEGNRWYLLKRLGLLVDRQNLYYSYGSTSSNIDFDIDDMLPHEVNCPIPQSQIDLMGDSFPQNEGYF